MTAEDLKLLRLTGQASDGFDSELRIVVIVDGLLVEGLLCHAGTWQTHIQSVMGAAADNRLDVGEHEGSIEEGRQISPYLSLDDVTIGDKGSLDAPLRIPVNAVSAWTILDSGSLQIH